MTKFRKFISKHDKRIFLIDEDLPDVGFVVYVFDSGCKNTHDYLQNNLEMAMSFAFDEWGVPLDSWKEIETLDGTGVSLDGTTA